MTLEEMEKDSRNRHNSVTTSCDPCRQPVRISGYCLMEKHRPEYCPTPLTCGCDCHHEYQDKYSHSTQGCTSPNLHSLVIQGLHSQTATAFGRSGSCQRTGHLPSQCSSLWCDCWCHKGEDQSDRVARSIVETSHNQAIRVGNKIGQKIWMVDEEGHNRQVLMLPSGEIMEIQ